MSEVGYEGYEEGNLGFRVLRAEGGEQLQCGGAFCIWVVATRGTEHARMEIWCELGTAAKDLHRPGRLRAGARVGRGPFGSTGWPRR